MIDKEAEQTVIGWLRLGDRVTGRTPVEGRCDHCGRMGYLTEVEKQNFCARCCLEGQAAPAS
jgi:hypothetical protein